MIQENTVTSGELEEAISNFMSKLGIRHKTTDQKIERAIRNAIEVSWERGNSDLFEELFGYSNSEEYSRPTNSEYIAAVADHIRLEYEMV